MRGPGFYLLLPFDMTSLDKLYILLAFSILSKNFFHDWRVFAQLSGNPVTPCVKLNEELSLN